MKIFTLLILLFLNINNSEGHDGMIVGCDLTPEIYHGKNLPKNFNESNNLRRITGSPEAADGKLIHISGIVTDKNCIPIQDAKIFMWQYNAYGKYQHEDHAKDGFDKNFAGTGTAITNNLGRYNFITIFPGDYNNKEAFLNFSIHHDDFLPFETQAFFSDRAENLTMFAPKIAKRLIATAESDNEYQLNITLNGANRYRKY